MMATVADDFVRETGPNQPPSKRRLRLLDAARQSAPAPEDEVAGLAALIAKAHDNVYAPILLPEEYERMARFLVEVGGVHVERTGPLDVERLAKATARVVGWTGALDYHREWAEKVAREYAALA